MRSMTGFGTAEATVDGVTVTAEVRAVNHRFLDIAVKVPVSLASLESKIREFIKERLSRGRITCTIQMEMLAAGAPVVLDETRLEQGLELLQRAAEHLEARIGQKPQITLDHLLAVPDLFCKEDVSYPEQSVWAALESALTQAVTALMAMKDKEGLGLAAELAQRLEAMRGHLAAVQQLAPQAVTETLERLQARLEQLVVDQLDPQRLAQEAALLADRSNINEECERLSSHIEQFSQALDEGGQVAKRLNFLLQEMHREVNTMGSKTGMLAITQSVIAMKDEVESMREQVQNLE